MKVLVLNCGSSSIKYRLFQMPGSKALAKGMVQRIGEERSEAFQKAGDSEIRLTEPVMDHKQGLETVRRMLTDPEDGAIQSMTEIGACGHRVVHGGETFTGSVLVNEDVEKVIKEHSDLAPLHNPPNLMGIREAGKLLGRTPQVACFDTAFHQNIPQKAHLYALPYDMYEKYKIRRYGFHGISHRYAARRAAAIMNRGKYDVSLITCHLGNGCSVTAIKNGQSIDTSMGFTPLEGLVMGTRTGDFDPAIILHLFRKGHTAEELDKAFNRESGLLGISGVSNDVRDLEDEVDNGHRMAKLALDMFAYRIRKYVGGYLAVLGACDAIVLTGGIGENGRRMRSRILANMENLGIKMDEGKNAVVIGKEGSIETDDSRTRILVIPADEERAIARDTFLIATGRN